MIHRFINCGIKFVAANVSGFAGELIQSASQTFCAQTLLIFFGCAGISTTGPWTITSG